MATHPFLNDLAVVQIKLVEAMAVVWIHQNHGGILVVEHSLEKNKTIMIVHGKAVMQDEEMSHLGRRKDLPIHTFDVLDGGGVL